MEENKTGGVIRTVKKESNYVILYNSLFQDKRISFKAKGILAYLLSKPHNWETNIFDLYNQSTEGYGAIRSGIAELILTGYMELKNVWNDESKCFTGRFYIVREEPLFKSGYRLLINKNKSYSDGEVLSSENPLGRERVMKNSIK